MDDPKLRNGVSDFVNHILKYTLRLVKLDSGNQPVSIASGFMIPVGKKLRVISAGHTLGRMDRWVLEAAQAGETQTLCFLLTDIYVADELVKLPNGESIDVDLAWGEIDPDALMQQLRENGIMNPTNVDLPRYLGPLDEEPSTQEVYGFASWSQVELIEDNATLVRNAAYECFMEFVERDQVTDLYTFKLSREHQGHDYYRGASGAPIADPTGKIVSIVIRGCEAENLIYGTALSDYSELLTSESI